MDQFDLTSVDSFMASLYRWLMTPLVFENWQAVVLFSLFLTSGPHWHGRRRGVN